MSEMSCSQCGGIYGSGQEIERLRLDIVQRDKEIAVYEVRLTNLQAKFSRLKDDPGVTLHCSQCEEYAKQLEEMREMKIRTQ